MLHYLLTDLLPPKSIISLYYSIISWTIQTVLLHQLNRVICNKLMIPYFSVLFCVFSCPLSVGDKYWGLVVHKAMLYLTMIYHESIVFNYMMCLTWMNQYKKRQNHNDIWVISFILCNCMTLWSLSSSWHTSLWSWVVKMRHESAES